MRTEINVNISSVKHAGTSRLGNPTMRITTDDGQSFLTATDSMVGYGAENHSPRYRQAPIPVTLTLERGRVVKIDGPDFVEWDSMQGDD